MSRPSFGGAVALRGGDDEHQHGHHHLQQEARVRAAESTCVDKVYVIIFVLKSTRVARARVRSLSGISFLYYRYFILKKCKVCNKVCEYAISLMSYN